MPFSKTSFGVFVIAASLAAVSGCGRFKKAKSGSSDDSPANSSAPASETARVPAPPAASADKAPPTVTSFSPGNDEKNLPVKTIVKVILSEALDGASLNGKSLRLQYGPTEYVDGIIKVESNVLNLIPHADLFANTTYTVTLNAGLKDKAGNATPAGTSWSFKTTTGMDLVAPALVSLMPAADSTSVPVNTAVIARMSEPLDPASVTAQSFVLRDASHAEVPGAFVLQGNHVRFAPTQALVPNTKYTLALKQGLKDLFGNSFEAEKVLSFTTGSSADAVVPKVVNTMPALNAQHASAAASVWAEFSEPMDVTTLTAANFKVLTEPEGVAVAGAISAENTKVFLAPSSRLTYGKTYRIQFGAGIKDLQGNALAAAPDVLFTVGAALSTVSSSPAHNDTNVTGVGGGTGFDPIEVVFNETLKASSVTSDQYKLKDEFDKVFSTTVSVQTNRIEIMPLAALSKSKTYTLVFDGLLLDQYENGFASVPNISFKTIVDAAWESEVKQLITTKCANCHPSFRDRDNAFTYRSAIAERVGLYSVGAMSQNSRAMPKGASLSSAERTALINWANTTVP